MTITDAIEAGALAAFGGTAARTVLAAKAGMDIILCSARDVSQGQAAVDALASANLGRGDSEKALQRVLAMRGKLG